ncbi:hypothetical protein SAMD00019534_088110 [Acytostelium subglobosum LB1]|uniref:hypothetical protein n=1 Tax=Acytostelium subglobosum LB1 TaxID=1410327 RepID=UPI000644A188|nr:hypothetical protein SAMD00019534_088110 [Acytostelium subglobosum LB1]GAM25636.1 hypothetical protein SAMD00019534_088110 [Acytostelium subglobosum LB1]|eukprot:XP_012751622.1 hypothetical protein SAMD00019534_088110 [Acytostelium subglobosum LB1]
MIDNNNSILTNEHGSSTTSTTSSPSSTTTAHKLKHKQHSTNQHNNNNKRGSLKTSSTKSTLTSYLIYLALVISIGAYLFFSGFLLIRFELPMKSTCAESPLLTANRFTNASHSPDTGCWMPFTYKRAVIVIIDALRFDFLAPQPPDTADLSPFFHNKLTSVTRLLEQQPSNSLIFRFIADSPTVTMQRIKGITTGSLPTFIDVGSNFGGDAIVEDNLIHQLSFNDDEHREEHLSTGFNRSKGHLRKKVVFIGDDTWVTLFPHHFYSQYDLPSFNVKDLHTVDNGVIDYLLPTITRIQSDEDGTPAWHVAIGHMLGVDHVGHLHGPNHPEMIKKLAQMDEFLSSVINNIDKDTLFVLFGDHGMTSEGNHGGASEDETDAALFMYSPGIPINNNIPEQFTSKDKQTKSISQIDLVSTISLLLGVPIPYGNLGSIIPELFLATVPGQHPNHFEGWQRFIDAQRINAWQIMRYVDSYSSVSKEFPKHLLKHFHRLIDETERQYAQISSDPALFDEAHAYKVYQGYRELQEEIVDLCRKIWATFDTFSMIAGLSIMCLSLLTLVVLLLATERAKRTNSEQVTLPLNAIVLSAMVGMSVSAPLHSFVFTADDSLFITVATCATTFSMATLILKLVLAMIPTSGSLMAASTLPPQAQASIKPKQSHSYFNLKTILFVIPCVSVLAHGLSLLSNSFIEAQQHVVNFFAVTLILLAIVASYWIKPKWTVSDTLYSLAILVSFLFTSPRFRAEKFGDLLKVTSSDDTLTMQAISTLLLNSITQWAWCLPTLYIFIGEVVRRLELALLPAPSSIHRSLRLSAISMVCIAGHWLVQSISYQTTLDHTTRGVFPWLVYGIALFGLGSSFFSSMSTTHKPTAHDSIKHVFFKLIEVLVYFFTLFILLLGPVAVSNLTWMLIHTCLLTRLMGDIVQHSWLTGNHNHNRKEYIYWLITYALCGFLTLNHFFSTGHDYSFNKIQFESAFIGFDDHMLWRDGLLVTLNTFASPIFFALFLPIMVIYSRFIVLAPRKQQYNSVGTSTSMSSLSPPSSFALNVSQQQQQKIDQQVKHLWLTMSDMMIGFLLYLFFFLFNTINICVSVYILRRHLMVWRVFAPKYIFETCQLFIVMVFLIIASLLVNFHKSRIKMS